PLWDRRFHMRARARRRAPRVPQTQDTSCLDEPLESAMILHSSREGAHYSSRSAALAAPIVLSTSFVVCAAERNHASNCDGGGYTPRANIPLKNFAYCWVFALVADA